MLWVSGGLTVWLLVTASLLLVTGNGIRVLRAVSSLREAEGALWAGCTAQALTFPPILGLAMTGIALFSVLTCAESSGPLVHACLHTIAHWCGHSSFSAAWEVHDLSWLVSAWTVGAFFLAFLIHRRSHRLRRSPPSPKLLLAARTIHWDERLPLWEAETEAPSGLVGLRHPFVFVARWLISLLRLEELQAVLRHERAHWHRRDNWWRCLLFSVAFLFWFVPSVRWLYREWRQAAEEAADDLAAPDPITARHLAHALQRVWTEIPEPFPSFADDGVQRRIRRLLSRPATPQERKGGKGWEVLAMATFALTPLFAPPLWFTLHCLTEVLLL